MLSQFLDFVISVLKMIVSVFQYTDLGGFSYENVLVAILILGLIVRVIMVKMG